MPSLGGKTDHSKTESSLIHDVYMSDMTLTHVCVMTHSQNKMTPWYVCGLCAMRSTSIVKGVKQEEWVGLRIEQIELQAKLLNYFLGSNKSNIKKNKTDFIFRVEFDIIGCRRFEK